MPKPSKHHSRPRCGTTAAPFEWSKVATKRTRNAIMSFLVFFRFAGAQRLGPRDPMGPKGGALRGQKGPLGLGGYSEAISNGWPLRMEGNFDWNAISNGRSFRYMGLLPNSAPARLNQPFRFKKHALQISHFHTNAFEACRSCLLYTSDAADD